MITLLLLTAGDNPGLMLINQARAAYAKMPHFEMSIQHHNDNGLFPGDYTQRLIWKGKGRFTLLVTKGNPKTMTLSQGLKAPDYVAGGGKVNIKWPDGRRTSESLAKPTQMPGWEISGGFPLMMLEETKSLSRVFDPSPSAAFQWKMGLKKMWNKMAVREVVGTMKNNRTTARLFLEAKRPLIVGVVLEGGFNGWTRFYDFKLRP
jgi:hypothetical protein